MFSIDSIYAAESKDIKEIIEEVFPSLLILDSTEDEYPATTLPDGSIMTPGGVVISFNGTGEMPVGIDFKRPSRRAAGALIFRLLEAGIKFKAMPRECVQSHAGSGYSTPKEPFSPWVTPDSIRRWAEDWNEGIVPLHPEMGRCAWDPQFRQAHPELSWAFPKQRPTRERGIIEGYEQYP